VTSFVNDLKLPPVSREDESHLDVDCELFDVIRGEVGAVIHVKDLWDAANVPMWMPLPPNRLSQRQCYSHGRRRVETEIVARNARL
jgi:hypothetical protein